MPSTRHQWEHERLDQNTTGKGGDRSAEGVDVSNELAHVIDRLTSSLLRVELARRRTTDPAIQACLDDVIKDVWALASMMETRYALEPPGRTESPYTAESENLPSQAVPRRVGVWGQGTGDAVPEGVRGGSGGVGADGILFQLGE